MEWRHSFNVKPSTFRVVMQLERPSTVLPSPPLRPPAGTDWGAVVASLLCLAFAAIGALPFLLAGVLRSSWAEDWAAQQTQRLLSDHGVVATYRVGVRLWPVAVELADLRVASTDGGSPALKAPRASVRPRLFSLLAGKFAI